MLDASNRATDEKLKWFLDAAADGRLRLPDFQRDWVWDDRHIRSLLASISLAYPVGAVMLLQADDRRVTDEAVRGSLRFKQRLLAGAPSPTHEVQWLILDGQQRLTSLFQSLLSGKPVETKGGKSKRWYYIDMEDALSENVEREDAVLSVPENKMVKFQGKITADYSTPEKEYEAMVFPLSSAFRTRDWRKDFNDFWDHAADKVKLWDDFEEKIIAPFQDYRIPMITLGNENPPKAICQVFEKVNTGGVTLTVFDLLTATFAANGFDLREDWDKRKKRLKGFSVFDRSVLDDVSATDFLQAATLLATQRRNAISCRRADMLNLTLTEYQDWAEPLMEGFKRAGVFLNNEGIFDHEFIPYGSQMIPLAAIYAVLDRDLTQSEREKLARWYWCGVFGQLYSSATENRFANDLPEVVEWIRGGERLPQTVENAVFSAPRLLSLKTRGSAAYKGMYSLLLRNRPKDLLTGEEMNIQHHFDQRVQVHHIFPQKWCRVNRLDEKKKMWKSIVNKTPLTSSTNRWIGGSAPSEHTTKIDRKNGFTPEVLDAHLLLHCIDPEHLRNDDYDKFFEARQEALIALIEQAMGKRVVRDDPEEGDDEDEADDEE